MTRPRVVVVSIPLSLVLAVFLGCSFSASPRQSAAEPADPASAAPEPAKATPVPAKAAPEPAKAAPASATAEAPPGADGGGAVAAGGGGAGPFEPTGEPLALPGLTLPPEGARPYVPLGLQWPVVSALLDATPGLRVRQHVGFYPPRPLDLTGRPQPYTFGSVNALSRPGTWRAAADATFVLVPFHHEKPSLAIYAPAGEGTVRFVTRAEPFACEEGDGGEIGFVITRPGDAVQVLRTCGESARVTTYRAEGGKLTAREQSLQPSELRPAGDEGVVP